jgi:hypothetical protein
MVALQTYLAGRQQFRAALQPRQNHSLALNEDLETAWGLFVQDLVKGNVGFEQMYNRLLSRDDLSREVNIGR